MKMKMRMLAGVVVFGLMAGMGNMAMAQTAKPAVVCPSSITNLPSQPYIGYGNHAMIQDSRRQWIADHPVACQTYVTNLENALNAINVTTLSADCQQRYNYRTKELNRVKKDAQP